MKKRNLITLVMLLLANVFVTVNSSATNLNPKAGLNVPTSIKTVNTDQNSLDSAVVEGSLPITFENDSVNPCHYLKENGVIIFPRGSKLTFSYESTEKNVVSFVLNSSDFNIWIDDSLYNDNLTYDDYYCVFKSTQPSGKHTVVVQNYYNYDNRLMFNLNIGEVRPIEETVISKESEPITIKTDSLSQWICSKNGIVNINSSGKLSSNIKIDKPSIISFSCTSKRGILEKNDDYETLLFKINGYDYRSIVSKYNETKKIAAYLEPGEYELEWIDNTKAYGILEISDIKLSSNWINLDVASAGTLGAELLKNVKDLNDVEMLKVTGSINFADWRDIKHLYNLIALDLSEAQVEEVPHYAFEGLHYITEVKLPEGLKSIGTKAFVGTNIRRIIIPSTVETISKEAFASTPLRNIEFKDGSILKSIGESAFNYCTNLEEFIMPNSVTELGQAAFAENYALKKIVFSDSITYIPYYTCYANTSSNLTEVHLPKNLKEIGYKAFWWNNKLKRITFPKNLTTIYDEAFKYCDLDSIALPLKLQTLGDYAFYNNENLKYIELPSDMKDFSTNAFSGCSNVNKIVCHSATPPIIDTDPFSSMSKSTTTLVVPSFALNAYKQDTYWYQFMNIVPEDMELDYWKIDGKITLTDECRILGKPNIEIIENGVLNVESNAPMDVNKLYISNGGKYTSNGNNTLNIAHLGIEDYMSEFTSTGNSKINIDSLIVNGKFNSTGDGSITIKKLYVNNNFASTGNNTITIDSLKINYGAKFTLGGNKPADIKALNLYTSPSNTYRYDNWGNYYGTYPTSFINDCDSVTADSIKTIMSVNSNQWYFISPVYDVDLSKVYHTDKASYVFRYFDGNERALNGMGNSWKNVTDGKLIAGKGYIFQCSRNGEIVLPAEAGKNIQLFNTKDVTDSLVQYKSANITDDSWNFIGNPYPACYSIKNMDFTAPITVWTGNTYRAYSITDDDYVLYPNQGIFVQKPAELDSIVFHKEGRKLDAEIKQPENKMAFNDGKNERLLFNINITDGNGMIDETRVVLNEKASLDYEINCDASKFMSIENDVPQIYTLDSNLNRYAINERPEGNGEVTLGYYTSAPGKYTISASRADGIVTLYDKKYDTSVVLSEQEYTFSSELTNDSNDGRFVLKFYSGDTTDIINAQNKQDGVTATENGIMINNGNNAEYQIFSLDGKMVKSGKTQQYSTNVQLKADTYIVKMNGYVYKVIVL